METELRNGKREGEGVVTEKEEEVEVYLAMLESHSFQSF